MNIRKNINVEITDWRKPINNIWSHKGGVQRIHQESSPKITTPKITLTKIKKNIQLSNLFKQSRDYILGLPNNWDGYNAQVIKVEILNQTLFILKNIIDYSIIQGIEIPFPLILPVPDGSIDLNWETDKFELLINIPSTLNESVSLYGEKVGDPAYEIEVRIPYKLVEMVIIKWLKEIY